MVANLLPLARCSRRYRGNISWLCCKTDAAWTHDVLTAVSLLHDDLTLSPVDRTPYWPCSMCGGTESLLVAMSYRLKSRGEVDACSYYLHILDIKKWPATVPGRCCRPCHERSRMTSWWNLTVFLYPKPPTHSPGPDRIHLSPSQLLFSLGARSNFRLLT